MIILIVDNINILYIIIAMGETLMSPLLMKLFLFNKLAISEPRLIKRE